MPNAEAKHPFWGALFSTSPSLALTPGTSGCLPCAGEEVWLTSSGTCDILPWGSRVPCSLSRHRRSTFVSSQPHVQPRRLMSVMRMLPGHYGEKEWGLQWSLVPFGESPMGWGGPGKARSWLRKLCSFCSSCIESGAGKTFLEVGTPAN